MDVIPRPLPSSESLRAARRFHIAHAVTAEHDREQSARERYILSDDVLNSILVSHSGACNPVFPSIVTRQILDQLDLCATSMW